MLTNLEPRPAGKWPEPGIEKLDGGDISTELRPLMSLKPVCRGGLPTRLDLEGLKGRSSMGLPERSPSRTAEGSLNGDAAREGPSEWRFKVRSGPKKGLVEGVWWTERDECDWECEWVRVAGYDGDVVARGKDSESELIGEGDSSGRGR